MSTMEVSESSNNENQTVENADISQTLKNQNGDHQPQNTSANSEILLEILDDGKEISVSEIMQHADPISPPTAVQRNDVLPSPTDDNTPKIILNLVTGSQYENETEDEKKIAKDQLEELKMQSSRNRRKKGIEQTNRKGNKKSDSQNGDEINNGENENNEDLVAIRKGQNEGHYEVVTLSPPKKQEEKKSESTGRKRKTNPKENANRNTPTLINALAFDWSDDNEETKPETTVRAIIETKKSTTGKKHTADHEEIKIISTDSSKPKRIIKKKIIWDPDAPETHYSAARFIQNSTPVAKKISKSSVTPQKLDTTNAKAKIIAEKSPTNTIEVKNDSTPPSVEQKTHVQTPTSLGIKKKKLTEKDRLLQDEGVSMMLNALENNRPSSRNSAKREITIINKRSTPVHNAQQTNVIMIQERKDTPSPAAVASKQRDTPMPKKRQNTASPVSTTPQKKMKPATKVQNNTIMKKDDTPLPRKRIPKPKKDNWDFVYNQRDIDSLIIRRRSSSYSSTTSPRRLSLETSAPNSGGKQSTSTRAETAAAQKQSPSKIIIEKRTATLNKRKANNDTNANTRNNDSFEFAKPEVKVNKKESSEKKSTKEIFIKQVPKKTSKNAAITSNNDFNNLLEQKQSKTSFIIPSVSSTKNVEVKQHDNNIIQLKILYPMEKSNSTSLPVLTVQILKDLTKDIESLAVDKLCKAVVITSSDHEQYCWGIDIKSLVISNSEKRKNAAYEMAKCVRDFLRALLLFPKPLLTGVQGSVSGIAVTMLPLFDIVVASDKSTFKAPYAQLGQIPEGHCIFTLTNTIKNSFKTNLLWFCQETKASEAAIAGLVTRLTKPNTVENDTLLCANKIVECSTQTFCAMKEQRLKHELTKFLIAIDDEEKILANHWITPECQENIKNYEYTK